MRFGCHISIVGGVEKAPQRAVELGCEVFQMFTRSPQGGKASRLTYGSVEKFKEEMVKFGFGECLVHTPYFINYGSGNNRIFFGSVSVVRQELDRASLLGVTYVVTHLGSYRDLGREKGLKQIISGLQKTLHSYSGSARLLLENSAGAGEIAGRDFAELAKIISHPKLKRAGLGFCLDTAHAFASGYDLRTSKAVAKTLAALNRTVGLDKLKAIHANDSKIKLGGKRDRHDHIGSGKIGVAGFKALVRHPDLKSINMYLETEHGRVARDLDLLKTMRNQTGPGTGSAERF